MIISKFGGTSVADGPAITRLIDIVRARVPERPVIVVSALARVTDALLSLARRAGMADEAELEAGVSTLLERHGQVAREVPGGPAAMDAISADGEALRQELGCVRRRMATPAELDAIAGRGELWSSLLV
jgi:aspartokinase